MGSGFDDVIGSSVLNEINAGAGADEVDAGAGPDEIEGTPGDDDFEGGADEDILEFNYSAAPVNVDLEAGTATGQGSDLVSGVENLRGTIFDDVLTGDGLANVIFGNLGGDQIDGKGSTTS